MTDREEYIDSKEAVLLAANTLGFKLAHEWSALRNPNNHDSEQLNIYADIIRGAISKTISNQFGDSLESEKFSDMLDEEYLRVCETGMPTEELMDSVKDILSPRVEEWMREDFSLTFYTISIFQKMQVFYWAQQLTGPEDINLENVPLFYKEHLPVFDEILKFGVSKEEIEENVLAGWHSYMAPSVELDSQPQTK